LVALAACVVSFWNRVDDSWDRQALRAVDDAATNSDTSIGIISEPLADRWSSTGGPREEAVQSRVSAGNSYLEPIYYARHDSSNYFEEGSDRCYYLAVQPGEDFDPDQVSAIMQICYLDPYKTPQSTSYAAVTD
jgi:hypothetical protein